MKNLILVFLVSIISLSTMGQRFHADNNIRDIKLNSKKFKEDPITYNIVEKFGRKIYVMPNESGESELPFQIAFYEDLKNEGVLSSGEQKMVATRIYAALPLLNSSGNHVDEFQPKGLTAQKGRKMRGTLYLERGDYSYKAPERIKVEGVEYFLFEYGKDIIVTPVDADITDRVDYGNRKVSFVNEDDFYIFEEVDSNYEENDMLEPKVTSKTTSTTTGYSSSVRPHYIEVKDGNTLYGISQEYGVSIDRLKELNPKLKVKELYVGQRIRVS